MRIIKIQAPALLHFDHLYSEYQTIKSDIQSRDAAAADYIDNNLSAKRENKTLTWNNLYYFELTLSNYLPVERLRSKIMRLRHDFRSVAGEREFDDYLASKPPDLQSPPDLSAPPPTQAQYENLLREDLKDLLGRLYKRYSILPVKEARLNILTWIAGGLCLVSLITLLGIVIYLFQKSGENQIKEISSLTILVVVVAGAMGGFVSALQRIQTPPEEGDSLYNLSLLFYGSYTVFVAPITGSIFAILLYLMFTGELLTGSFFPQIYTPPPSLAQSASMPENSPSAVSNAEQNTNTEPSPNLQNSASIKYFEQPGGAATLKSLPSAKPTPTPKPKPGESLNVMSFLTQSGPAGGTDYALLIIWCFIAGFAERFVPDALDRLISNNAGRNKKS